MTASRVAIGAAHRDQVAALRRALDDAGLDGVVADTANRLQGREFDVVIVLHPLSGRRDATAFHLEAGRLCVLASRHQHACIMVARAGIPELLEGWLTEPNVRSTVPGVHHHDVALGFLRSAGTANNLTTDAQLAAIAVENDATVYSNDSDFARFDGVKWINPLAPR